MRGANEVASVLRYVARQLQERSQALRGTLERFAVALRGADIVVYGHNREQRMTWISETARHGETVVGRRSDEVLPPASSAEAAALEQRALATGEPQEGEVQEHGTGDAAHHSAAHRAGAGRGRPGDRAAGRVFGDRRAQAIGTAQRLAGGRGQHRAKNLLTVVPAMASETGRSAASVSDFNERFLARIRALAKLQDVAIGGTGGEAPLRELVQAQLEAFIDPASGRMRTEGPDVRLTAQAASTLAIAVHETCDQHGEVPGRCPAPMGALRYDGTTEQDGATRHFRLVWAGVGAGRR